MYDENGSPLCFDLYSGSNTTPVRYYYVTNLQGDVVRLINSNNATVADYTYDAWGKLLGVTDSNGNAITSEYHIANINPLRYRGYFYDIETGLYYCNSRYYDPQVRRFVSADGYASTGQGFGGYNMFAYCNNSPIVYSDITGFMAMYMPGNPECGAGENFYTAVAMTGATCVVSLMHIPAPSRGGGGGGRVSSSPTTPSISNTDAFSSTELPKYTPTHKPLSASTKTAFRNKTDELIYADTKSSVVRYPRDPVHHIVAQNAEKAKPAQDVLELANINRFKDPANLVVLPTFYHRRIHSKDYYEYVNKVVCSAWAAGGRDAVYEALGVLKIEIYSGTLW